MTTQTAGPDTIVGELQEALNFAARLGAQAERLEEERKILFSELFMGSTEKGVDAREHAARADLSYQEKTKQLNDVREQAAVWKSKALALQTRVDVWRTRMASARQRTP